MDLDLESAIHRLGAVHKPVKPQTPRASYTPDALQDTFRAISQGFLAMGL
jgi:hypothetical protein